MLNLILDDNSYNDDGGDGGCSVSNLLPPTTSNVKQLLPFVLHRQTSFIERESNKILSLFKDLPQNDQLELIEEASNEVIDHQIQVMEKLSEENEEDFRRRRFKELLKNLDYKSLENFWFKARLKWIEHQEQLSKNVKPQLECGGRVLHQLSGSSEFDADTESNNLLSMFKDLSENDQLKLIEDTTDEVVNTIIKKLPRENEEEFRLRRFMELLNNLPLESLQMFWFTALIKLNKFKVECSRGSGKQTMQENTQEMKSLI